MRDGGRIRIPGKGGQGIGGGPPGDLWAAIRVRPHPIFRREGHDLSSDVPISVREAALGAKVEVPTPEGRATVTVPPGTDSGARCACGARACAVRGRRSAATCYVDVQIRVPRDLDDAGREALEELARFEPARPAQGALLVTRVRIEEVLRFLELEAAALLDELRGEGLFEPTSSRPRRPTSCASPLSWMRELGVNAAGVRGGAAAAPAPARASRSACAAAARAAGREEVTALSGATLVERARELQPLVRSFADRAEAERTLPAEVVRALREAGLFRIAVAREVGGAEATPREQILAIEAISEADGAAGWALMIGIETLGFASACLSPTSRKRSSRSTPR